MPVTYFASSDILLLALSMKKADCLLSNRSPVSHDDFKSLSQDGLLSHNALLPFDLSQDALLSNEVSHEGLLSHAVFPEDQLFDPRPLVAP